MIRVGVRDPSPPPWTQPAYENQLRGLVPQDMPWGAVVERDGPLARTRHGAHGTVDPTLVGGPGQPRWTSYAYLVDEHVVQVTKNLRMGTFGNWREASLCVFGDELLAHVDEELTDLLGIVLRRGGRPVGNVWSFP
ncbi:DUF2716 domain-containing protein [Streptosporangium sp. NPDC002607]